MPESPTVTTTMSEPDAQPARNQQSTPSSLRPIQRKHKLLISPWAVLFLIISFASIISCIIVVYFANQRTVGNWIPHVSAVQPAVLLAVFTSVFSFSIKGVFLSGVAVVWWRTASKRTRLADLHHIWNRGKGTGFMDTLKALKRNSSVRLVAIVFAVITAVDIGDGPLLQHSIRPVSSIRIEKYQQYWTLPAVIPDGWFGTMNQSYDRGVNLSEGFQGVLNSWYRRDLLEALSPCAGDCTGPLLGAGVTTNCSSSQWFLDLTVPASDNATLFNISFARAVDSTGSPVLEMTHMFTSRMDPDCNATISVERCTIRAATVAYDVLMQNSTFELDRSRWPQVTALNWSSGDLPGPDGTPIGALTGLFYFTDDYLKENAKLERRDPYRWRSYAYMAVQYEDTSNVDADNSSCALLRWKNATDDLLWDVHDVMFRAAVSASTSNETGGRTTWTHSYPALTYNAKFAVLWVASASMFCALLASASLLYGYRELGQRVTLSPLETGRALAASLAPKPGENRRLEIEDLIEDIGKEVVTIPLGRI